MFYTCTLYYEEMSHVLYLYFVLCRNVPCFILVLCIMKKCPMFYTCTLYYAEMFHVLYLYFVL